jgi:hypothetical protein
MQMTVWSISGGKKVTQESRVKEAKALFYSMLPIFLTSIVICMFPMLHLFVLLVILDLHVSVTRNTKGRSLGTERQK